MRLHSLLPLALPLALLSLPATAQDLCEGNGYGEAYIQVGPAYLGGFFSHDIGSPNAPNSFAVFSFSDGFQATVHPILGPVCLNVFSPVYGIIVLPTDANGNLHFDLFLPAVPSWVSLPPFYSNVVTFEGGNWSSSKTVPLWFENPDSWTPVAPMGTARMYHTATNLGQDGKDNRIKVFIAGGGGGTVTIPTATNTTEIFDPLSRTSTPGPTMLLERTTHTATLLQDGRVLLAGGLDTRGICTRVCEIYDRTTNSLTRTGDMSTERAGHTATLLDDGRVLVAGGFRDYQDPQWAWATALATSQSTAEVFDPATGAWTPAGPMFSKHSGHTATKLADGKVMVINGVIGGGPGSSWGGTVPHFSQAVELFDPATGNFSQLPPLIGLGRAFHGASLLPNGNVLVTGGVYTGGPDGEGISMTGCQLWNGSGWVSQAPLPVAVAWHNQVTLPNGEALVSGGLTADGFNLFPSSFTGIHTGGAIVTLSSVGLNPGIPAAPADARGAMSVTKLHDGSLLFLGGSKGTTTTSLATGYVYTPNP